MSREKFMELATQLSSLIEARASDILRIASVPCIVLDDAKDWSLAVERFDSDWCVLIRDEDSEQYWPVCSAPIRAKIQAAALLPKLEAEAERVLNDTIIQLTDAISVLQ